MSHRGLIACRATVRQEDVLFQLDGGAGMCHWVREVTQAQACPPFRICFVSHPLLPGEQCLVAAGRAQLNLLGQFAAGLPCLPCPCRSQQPAANAGALIKANHGCLTF